MVSYSDIIKQSYYITLRYPALWFFGLFVVGGFNLNYLRLQSPPLDAARTEYKLYDWLYYLTSNPEVLALVSLSLLLVSVIGLVLTNWSRVMLILSVDSIVQTKNLVLEEQWKKSRRVLWPTIKISTLTASFIVLLAGMLFMPTMLWVHEPERQTFLLTVATAIFLPIAFTASCINIFAGYFIVLYKNSLSSALRLTIDLVASKWVEILGLSLVLLVIYIASVMVGTSLIYAGRLFFSWLLSPLWRFGIFEFSAIIMVTRILSGILLWLSLAVLNVFFNTALLLLFFELIKPIKTEEKLDKGVVAQPATTI